MTDKIPVSCGRCQTRYREKVARLRDGYQGQCPNCGCFINYTNESMDLNIRKAMTAARRIRNGFIPEPMADTE